MLQQINNQKVWDKMGGAYGHSNQLEIDLVPHSKLENMENGESRYFIYKENVFAITRSMSNLTYTIGQVKPLNERPLDDKMAKQFYIAFFE